ncbi:hypothetical protein GE09DRAFT_345036 [Coniochaeta sp. 2T2.1]|nr:hypothetical protein GE09DRAFT_345036 [Coniochaeta sp. 2T2.1]
MCHHRPSARHILKQYKIIPSQPRRRHLTHVAQPTTSRLDDVAAPTTTKRLRLLTAHAAKSPNLKSAPRRRTGSRCSWHQVYQRGLSDTFAERDSNPELQHRSVSKTNTRNLLLFLRLSLPPEPTQRSLYHYRPDDAAATTSSAHTLSPGPSRYVSHAKTTRKPALRRCVGFLGVRTPSKQRGMVTITRQGTSYHPSSQDVGTPGSRAG